MKTQQTIAHIKFDENIHALATPQTSLHTFVGAAERKKIEQCNKWLILYEKKQQKNLITELRKFNLNSIEKFNFNSDPFDYLESVKLYWVAKKRNAQEREREIEKKRATTINKKLIRDK